VAAGASVAAGAHADSKSTATITKANTRYSFLSIFFSSFVFIEEHCSLLVGDINFFIVKVHLRVKWGTSE
jgi:hypothetical protein